MPPMANHGTGGRRSAAWRTYSSPAAGRPGLVGVSHTGPTLSWSAPAAMPASSCSGEWVESPISRSSPDLLAHGGHGVVVLAHVHAVGAGRQRQVGPVVDPQQRAVAVARGAPARGHRQQRVVGQRLVAQLEHVHTARQRGVQGGVADAGVADQVQPRPRQPRAPVLAVAHGSHRASGLRGCAGTEQRHGSRRAPAERAARSPTVEPDPGNPGAGRANDRHSTTAHRIRPGGRGRRGRRPGAALARGPGRPLGAGARARPRGRGRLGRGRGHARPGHRGRLRRAGPARAERGGPGAVGRVRRRARER